MKLNLGCMREILLSMEGIGYNESLPFNDLVERLPHYSRDELQYNCYVLCEKGYIDARRIAIDGLINPYIYELWDITPSGHALLDAIRPKSAFEKVKETISDMGPKALENVPELALTIVSEWLKNRR